MTRAETMTRPEINDGAMVMLRYMTLYERSIGRRDRAGMKVIAMAYSDWLHASGDPSLADLEARLLDCTTNIVGKFWQWRLATWTPEDYARAKDLGLDDAVLARLREGQCGSVT